MRSIFLALALLLASRLPAQLQMNCNKGFEVPLGANYFRYWTAASEQGHQFQRDGKVHHGGKMSIQITGKGINKGESDIDGALVYNLIPAALLKGKKYLELTGWVRSADTGARAGIGIMQLGSESAPLTRIGFLDPNTSGKWQKLQTRFELGSNVENVYIGGLLNGSGTVWLDDLELSIDGTAVKDIAQPIAEPTTGEVSFLKQHLVPLRGLAFDTDDRDLDALSQWVGSARIVAVGEPTHGTSEAFRFRLRLLRYLVEKKGFNTFMIEDELPEADLMNDYVVHGRDTARKLLQYFFPVWRNQELLDLIEWMRTYNTSHEQKIQFRGMDMQSAYVALRTLQRFATQYDTTLLPQSRLLNTLQQRFYSEKANRPRIKDSMILVSTQVHGYVQQLMNKAQQAPADSLKALWLQTAVLTQHYPNISWEKSSLYRDSCMSVNIASYARFYPESRMLIWAHNSHVSRAQGLMGDWLSRAFGPDYFPMGFTTSEGTYTASVDFPKTAWKVYPLENAYAGTAEYYFAKTGAPMFLLPLRDLPKAKETEWLNRPVLYRGIGFMHMDQQFDAADLRSYYDALIHVQQTNASHSFMLK